MTSIKQYLFESKAPKVSEDPEGHFVHHAKKYFEHMDAAEHHGYKGDEKKEQHHMNQGHMHLDLVNKHHGDAAADQVTSHEDAENSLSRIYRGYSTK